MDQDRRVEGVVALAIGKEPDVTSSFLEDHSEASGHSPLLRAVRSNQVDCTAPSSLKRKKNHSTINLRTKTIAGIPQGIPSY